MTKNTITMHDKKFSSYLYARADKIVDDSGQWIALKEAPFYSFSSTELVATSCRDGNKMVTIITSGKEAVEAAKKTTYNVIENTNFTEVLAENIYRDFFPGWPIANMFYAPKPETYVVAGQTSPLDEICRAPDIKALRARGEVTETRTIVIPPPAPTPSPASAPHRPAPAGSSPER